jgi:hypothetical protein
MYGFMMPPSEFDSIEVFSKIFYALLQRMGKISDLTEKMQKKKNSQNIPTIEEFHRRVSLIHKKYGLSEPKLVTDSQPSNEYKILFRKKDQSISDKKSKRIYLPDSDPRGRDQYEESDVIRLPRHLAPAHLRSPYPPKSI